MGGHDRSFINHVTKYVLLTHVNTSLLHDGDNENVAVSMDLPLTLISRGYTTPAPHTVGNSWKWGH